MADQQKPVSLNVVTVLYFRKYEDLQKKDPKLARSGADAFFLEMLETMIFRNNQKDPVHRPFLGFRKGSIGSEDESDLCTEAEALAYMGKVQETSDQRDLRCVFILYYVTLNDLNRDATKDPKMVAITRAGTIVHTVEDLEDFSAFRNRLAAFQKGHLLECDWSWCTKEEAIQYLKS